MNRMSVATPGFQRCCFCLPLRAGLLAWGYFKVIADALITLLLGYLVLVYISACLFFYCDLRSYFYTATLFFILIMVIANFFATCVFINGGHQKKLKQIRGFYIYSIWEFVVMTLLILVAVGISLTTWFSDTEKSHLELFTAYLVILAVHGYFILLLRSEVIKLNKFGEISFVNNSAEGQCMMTSYEKQAAIEHVVVEKKN